MRLKKSRNRGGEGREENKERECLGVGQSKSSLRNYKNFSQIEAQVRVGGWGHEAAEVSRGQAASILQSRPRGLHNSIPRAAVSYGKD